MSIVGAPSALQKDTQITRLVALWLAPLGPVTAIVVDGPVLAVACASLALTAIAFVARGLGGQAERALLAVALVGHCATYTAAFAGHAWQIDSHMLFFAVLAIVATMGSIPALLVATALTAVHHLTLGLVVPALVFPVAGVADALLRTLMHAAIVLFEVGVLAWSMRSRQQADAEIRRGRAELAESATRAAEATAAAEAARAEADAAADRTRDEGRRAAAAVEQIVAAARIAAESAAQAKTTVSRAAREAQQSGALVGRTRAAMSAIEHSSHEITRIVSLIDEIARQTDLLALNAAVESARAGEAGRGFAVVANEVRKLAQRSADAAQQIRHLVATSSVRVDEGAQMVDATGQALDRIVGNVAELDSVMQEIASVADEQSAGLSRVMVAIRRIDMSAPAGHAPDLRLPDAPRRSPQVRTA